MALEQYKKKRDFSKTPEPAGRKSRARKSAKSRKPIFVVQKHDASRLHYDFRLEVDGVLPSWAIPKGPSLDPKDKRLAVHVEDHPLEYANFEGVIPEGYGAGTVMVWDRGWWEPMDVDRAHAREAIEKGKLSFVLHGRKLSGAWTLARMGGSRQNDDGDNWLLIKKKDEHAKRGGAAILEQEPRSVKTKRSMEEIAGAKRPATWASNKKSKRKSKKRVIRKARTPAVKSVPRLSLASIPLARNAPMPRSVSPQLCTLVAEAPEGDAWLHEIKYDGYRFIIRRHGDDVAVLTRHGKDWTSKFAPLAAAVRALPSKEVIIDGEAAIVGREGRTSFQRLQNAIKKQDFGDLAFFAFDLLYLDGYDLTRTPLIERKRVLKQLLSAGRRSVVRFSDHIRGNGAAVFHNACKLGLEGVVSKQANSPYVQARTRTWLKVKCSKRQEFIIVGWTPPGGSRKHFGSLLLGAYDHGRLIYTGKVGTGFSSERLREIKSRLDALSRRESPLDERASDAELRHAHWVAPKLVAEVEFTEWTEDRRLRHPSFQGLRDDKEVRDVHIETPRSVRSVSGNGSLTASARRKRTSSGASKRREDGAEVAGVRISNPSRVLFPEKGITKLDLARYYEAIGDHILPHIINRPLSTVRCPTGRTGQCFFQKHLRETFDDPVKPIAVREKGGTEDYISIDSLAGLITLVQFGVLEIHPWGATKRNLEKPDLLTFDLDPGEGVGFGALRAGAMLVRDVLAGLELESYLKSTGGKGLHVVVPIKADASWDEAKEFCGNIARGIARQEPRKYIATMSKSKRRGLIYIDYLRNSRGATSIAPYSTRAREGAPVAAPLRWDELPSLKGAAPFNTHSMLQRIKRLKADPWAGFVHKQKLTKSRLRAAATLHAQASRQ